jgi:hypothetical protein
MMVSSDDVGGDEVTAFGVTTDNIEAAMERVAEVTSPGRASRVQTEEHATKQVICRANEYDHERWKQAAAKMGVSMAEFIRLSCNSRAADLLDCPHPLNERRWYPWAEMCLRCGIRLRG